MAKRPAVEELVIVVVAMATHAEQQAIVVAVSAARVLSAAERPVTWATN